MTFTQQFVSGMALQSFQRCQVPFQPVTAVVLLGSGERQKMPHRKSKPDAQLKAALPSVLRLRVRLQYSELRRCCGFRHTELLPMGEIRWAECFQSHARAVY